MTLVLYKDKSILSKVWYDISLGGFYDLTNMNIANLLWLNDDFILLNKSDILHMMTFIPFYSSNERYMITHVYDNNMITHVESYKANHFLKVT